MERGTLALVYLVAVQLDLAVGMLGDIGIDDLPGLVAGAIIDTNDFLGDALYQGHFIDLVEDIGDCALLVIDRHDDAQLLI
jgi:hypothetical protein